MPLVGRWPPLLTTAAALLLTGAGCEPDLGDTAVFLEVYRPGEAPVPERLQLTWFDDRQVLLRNEPIPASGVLDRQGTLLATVVFEIVPDAGQLERRALVLGLRGADLLGRGFTRVTVQPGSWITRPVELLPPEAVADADQDGVPDDIDNCPGLNDLEGCAPTAARPAGRAGEMLSSRF